MNESALSDSDPDILVGGLDKLPASVVHDALRKLEKENRLLQAGIKCLKPPVRLTGRVFKVTGQEMPG